MTQEKNRWSDRLHRRTDRAGNMMVGIFHFLALFAIGALIAWGAFITFLDMIAVGHPEVDDILLMFIYLELGAMVGIYFRTNHMPVRFLIYVAITALTRMMIGDIQNNHHEPDMGIIYIASSVLLLSFAILIVRYGSFRFPSAPAKSRSGGESGERDDTLDEH